MVLAHITDLHVAREEDYRDPTEAHWIPRVRKHAESVLESLLSDLMDQRPDHVVLTGDLTQTSKREEFDRARSHLDRHLGSVGLSVLPGNHDRWRREAVEGRWFESAFEPWLRSDLGGEAFPICHLIGPIAVVALDSSPFYPDTDPSKVCGHVSEAQLEALPSIASHPEVRSRFLVVALHHHLRLSREDALLSNPQDATPLLNAAEVERALARTHVSLVLHGHRHRQMRLELDLAGRKVPVICPGSSSRLDPREERTARYGLYRIEGRELVEVRFRRWDPFGERMEWVR